MATNDEHPASLVLAVSTVIFALRPSTRTGKMSLHIPVVRRIREPYEGLWALPGGPLGMQEDLGESARRHLLSTTHLDPTYLEQLYAFGDRDRSRTNGIARGDRVVSIVYWALVRSGPGAVEYSGIVRPADEVVPGDDNVVWIDADELPELAFDHTEIVAYALWRLRTKLEYSRIAHSFLGEMFTLAQLREVHEAVLRRELDPANFRRMIEATGSVEPTGTLLQGTPHRPPKLYRYVENPAESTPGQTPHPTPATKERS